MQKLFKPLFPDNDSKNLIPLDFSSNVITFCNILIHDGTLEEKPLRVAWSLRTFIVYDTRNVKEMKHASENASIKSVRLAEGESVFPGVRALLGREEKRTLRPHTKLLMMAALHLRWLSRAIAIRKFGNTYLRHDFDLQLNSVLVFRSNCVFIDRLRAIA